MKILPIRNTVISYVQGRNEKVFCFLIFSFFLFVFSNQNFIDQYPEIPDYDLSNPQDRMAVEFHKTAIDDSEMLAHLKFLKNRNKIIKK